MNEDPVGHLHLALGDEKIRAIVKAFYAQVPDDDILGPMYPMDDLEGAEERLADFIVFRFGGPRDYLTKRGHPRLRMRHMPFQIDQAAADRWMKLMGSAIQECGVEEIHAEPMMQFFGGVAEMMKNQ